MNAVKITLLFFVLIAIRLPAQTLYFNGLGRVLVTNDAIDGNINVNDKQSIRKATGGYTLFDLGINVQPSEFLRASVTLRAKNAFGGFYGDGSVITFRQFKLDGIISKKVKYEVGDIDLMLTPYTLFNNYESYIDHEAELFNQRRKIVYYENFNFGNKWRLQGANVTAQLVSDRYIEKIGLQFFATRIARANYFNNQVPDRLLLGSRIDVLQSKYFQYGLNYAQLNDVHGTSPSPSVVLNNKVLTGDWKLSLRKGDFVWSIYGEAGGSTYTYSASDSSRSKQDYFYDAGISMLYKPLKLKVFAAVKNVGKDFNSPSAQTRRVFDLATNSLFPSYTFSGATTWRTPTLFDRFTDEKSMRNTTIMDTLVQFNPLYNNVQPYGSATPNRQGITAGISLGTDEKIVHADLNMAFLQEVTEEINNGRRQFLLLQGGANVNLNKWWKRDQKCVFTMGFQYEKTKRDLQPNVISLQSGFVDVGLSYEILKSFDILFAYKTFSGKGNEFYSKRDAFNVLVTNPVQVLNFDLTQQIFGGGLRLCHSKNSFTTLQYYFIKVNDSLLKDSNGNALEYNVKQLFVQYNLIF